MKDFSDIDTQLDAWIDARSEEIVQAAQGLLRIPSVKGEPMDNAPFGLECRRALDFALNLTRPYGLTTKNVDGYAGHAEWRADGVAADAPIVGVLAHVDVVPEGDGWGHPPYGAEVHDGKIYARGASDDKGPAIAGMFAVLALKECGVPLTHRVRLILGADEESGFGCVKHYFEHEEMPATGFTPDAMFPLCYAEKGIANVTLARAAPPEGRRIHVVSLRGGRRPNMVPDFAECILAGAPGTWAATIARLNAVVGANTEELDGGTKLRVTAKGISAHGSTPTAGVNAVVVLCDALLLLDHEEDQIDLVRQIRNWGEDDKGEALGIKGADDIAGPLTNNLGVCEYAEGQVALTFNIRYPVTWNSDTLRAKLEAGIAGSGFAIEKLTDQPPLYIPLDDPLVSTLLQVYRDETGDTETPPRTMGGGTYARAMRKGVAYGPGFPGGYEGGGAHEVDECWPVDHLMRAAKIYAKALARLASAS